MCLCVQKMGMEKENVLSVNKGCSTGVDLLTQSIAVYCGYQVVALLSLQNSYAQMKKASFFPAVEDAVTLLWLG